jgi:hypothetical protein
MLLMLLGIGDASPEKMSGSGLIEPILFEAYERGI